MQLGSPCHGGYRAGGYEHGPATVSPGPPGSGRDQHRQRNVQKGSLMIDHLSAVLRVWVSDAIVLTMWFSPHRKRHVMFANVYCCLGCGCACTVSIPYHTTPHHTIPYHAIPCHTIPYRTVPYHTIPYHTIPYHTLPYLTIPYYTIPYHTYHAIPHHTVPYHIPYHTIPYHTIPYHTIPYHTIPYHTCTFL